MSTKAFVALFILCVVAIGLIPESWSVGFDSDEDFFAREATAAYVCADFANPEERKVCVKGVRAHLLDLSL